ncbi:MAG: methyltransferase domain-containing protein [Candidatus Bathyarchaeia archaeon]
MNKEKARLKHSVVKYYEERLETEYKRLIPLCYHPGGIETTDKVIEEAGISENSTVLDVASGPGDTAIYLAATLGSSVLGIDLSRKMVDYAHSLVKGVELNHQVKFVVADAEKIPFKDNIFDAAISECSLCLVPNMLKTLSEMKRVIKPETKVVVSDVVLIENLSAELNNFLSYASCIAGAKTLDEYVSQFKKAGFTEIKTLNLSPYVIKQIHQFLHDRGINLGEIMNAGKILLSKSPIEMNVEAFQKISFYLWLDGKIGYSMISGVKPEG